MDNQSSVVYLGVSVVAVGLAHATTLPFGGLAATVAAVSFAINYVAFIPAVLRNTELFFDLTGAISNATLACLSLALSNNPLQSHRRTVCVGMVLLWATRLGYFLFARILATGSDPRFTSIKKAPARFFNVWTLQGLWCWFNLLAVVILCTPGMDDAAQQPWGVLDSVGATLWVVGFGVEAVADAQKSAFRRDPSNKGRFISSGLWAYSRHPNYAGEITLWTGVTTICASAYFRAGVGWHWLGLWTPMFVALLLTKVSGLPMLERSADKKWGDDPEYKRYKARTPVLFPIPGS